MKPYITKNPPDGRYNVWCPFCDWHMADSMVARKRMGQHIIDNHPEEVWFKKGTEPKDLEPQEVSK